MTAELAQSRIAEARTQCTRFLLAEAAIGESFESLFVQTWRFGQILTDLKENHIRHGEWEIFVEATFPDLGRTEKEQTPLQLYNARRRRCQSAMAFFRENKPGPNATIPSHFTEESKRAYIFHLAPEKERPLLQGNEPIARKPTPMTFCNELLKFRRQEEVGLATRPPIDVLRNDFREPIKIIIDLVGPDFVASLLVCPECDRPKGECDCGRFERGME